MLVAGNRWKLAAKVSVNTMQVSIGGAIAGMLLRLVIYRRHRQYNVSHLCTAILAGLVAVTMPCSVVTPAESLLIGATGAIVAIASHYILEVLCTKRAKLALEIQILAKKFKFAPKFEFAPFFVRLRYPTAQF